MNQEIKAKWVAALRSGTYKQGAGNLRDNKDNFCCLGVLCDLKDDLDWEYPCDDDGVYSLTYEYRGASDLPKSDLMDWAGFPTSDDPESVRRIPSVFIEGLSNQLHDHNDNGVTFAQLADAIEAQL